MINLEMFLTMNDVQYRVQLGKWKYRWRLIITEIPKESTAFPLLGANAKVRSGLIRKFWKRPSDSAVVEMVNKFAAENAAFVSAFNRKAAVTQINGGKNDSEKESEKQEVGPYTD